ncbi:50S ribosomal protein L5 [Candidatus Woesearchaeota archaeon]|nr:50S ribosomal protein L5 [Candidatus Woesearchaeota archaeon]
MNPMRKIRIEKITLNVGAGKDEDKLKKGMKLLKRIAGIEPLKTFTSKRIPTWALRPGLAIGCKLTLRGKKAESLLKNLLEARDNLLSAKQFDGQGNFSFGIAEYINIPYVDYDPEIKVMGLEVAVTLERPGFHISRRKRQKKRVPIRHRIKASEAMQFMKEQFGTKIAEEEA